MSLINDLKENLPSISDNDTGIRGVPGVHRPGAKFAIILAIV
jgi:hypothetical protein